MANRYTLSEMARCTGKKPIIVSNIQKTLKLPIIEEGYPPQYVSFVKRVVALQSFSISSKRIVELLEVEKKILKLLHKDEMSVSHIWFLEQCCDTPSRTRRTLMLTGYDVGFAISGDAVQESLHFEKTEKELFSGRDMGEDILRVITKYQAMCASIRQQLTEESPALEYAVKWAKQVLR